MAQASPELLAVFENEKPDHRTAFDAEWSLAGTLERERMTAKGMETFRRGFTTPLSDVLAEARDRHLDLVVDAITGTLKRLPGVTVEGKFELVKKNRPTGDDALKGLTVSFPPGEADSPYPGPHQWVLDIYRFNSNDRDRDNITVSAYNEADGIEKEWPCWGVDDSPVSLAIELAKLVKGLPAYRQDQLENRDA
jgi:hypothetical protein